ncbi:DUF3164 family protein [Megalodesulfovibrio paquesii]
MSEEATAYGEPKIPEGYMEDAKGRMVPVGMVKDEHRLADELVKGVLGRAKALRADMEEFRGETLADIETYLELLDEKYGVKRGGRKGNVKLYTFDGRYRVDRQRSEHIALGEELEAARALIDECLAEWAEGSRDELKLLIQDTFRTDSQGKLDTGRILALRRIKIEDPRWQQAMQAIGDALRVVGAKTLLRVYERQSDGAYKPIALDMSAL